MSSLEEGLKKGFIDRQITSNRYVPRMIINQSEKKEFLANVLQQELLQCETFDFSVAFITQSGLNALKVQLADLHRRNIKGRLLTSTYLAFNAPAIFHSLLKIPNLEVRISETPGFHAKGYLFRQKTETSFVIGSSNLTLNALKQNYEWNVLLTSKENGEVLHQLTTHFETEWEKAFPLTLDWILAYQELYEKEKRKPVEQIAPLLESDVHYIAPNKMQRAALESLGKLRATGEKKGLIISATGTGKTYLAAFDVLQVKPKRMLFIVHREQILHAAMASFQKIIGGNARDYGIFSGNKREVEAKYLFATIQTMSKAENLSQFDQEDFDYLLIDEVHKAGAVSYHNVLDHFTPDFLLGMTATPERTDEFNIFELFDYNIAYEIRLQDALAEDLLCPFHYFGITDYEIAGEVIDDVTTIERLTMDERCHFLLEKLAYYGCDGTTPKGLVFCSSIKEAQILSEKFTNLGHPATYLTGKHSITEREDQIRRLEQQELEYLFTVDVFNEGIDIPKINQVVMLRATQSSIIFIQQLGRGLRKDPSKEFVTVIDFIGNYKNNYMIPMALSGDVSRDKERLRKDALETDYIAGLSLVNFEEIARKQIFQSINSAKLDSKQELAKLYRQVKQRLNRSPLLYDLEESGLLDPLVITDKYKNYPQFLLNIKEIELTFSQTALGYLTFVAQELLAGKRMQELIVLRTLLEHDQLEYSQIRDLFKECDRDNSDRVIQSVYRTLTTEFYRGSSKKSYQAFPLITRMDRTITFSPGLSRALTSPQFRLYFEDLVQTGLIKAKRYAQEPFTLYNVYRRRDVLRLLCWQAQLVDQNIGGYTYNRELKQFVIFVTLHKGAAFRGAQVAYEDQLLDVETMHWFTKSSRTRRSPEVKLMLEEEGWTFHLFVKKSQDEGKQSYYLGEVTPDKATITETKKPAQDATEKAIVHLNLKLKTALPYDLFRYFTE